ncbi:ATPase domain-containing protein [Rosistilla carotiformis]|uniref:ATPase domain-containing protein n=1 Tax=Rosistilla carotiformis TaxID=2528017 RepID=UPI0028F459FE|nr:ATPase domain-containing protein [Rosistilla carotiformis]
MSTGIETLDDILCGGLTADRLYLIEGSPGSGKTTLGLQFLLAGRELGGTGIYVTLSETKEELLGIAESHGWSLDGIHIHELLDHERDVHHAQYTMFEPSEVELSSTVGEVQTQVERLQPDRIVFDSLSEMRLLSQGALRYRRQILSLKQFFVGRGCTTLLLDDKAAGGEDQQLQSLAHGVIRLEQRLTDYGNERRSLRVIKHRGSDFIGGAHDLRLARGGMQVFPRSIVDNNPSSFLGRQVSSGLDTLDTLLGGGVGEGSSTLLLGPAGVGKSSLGMQFAIEAARRGQRAVLFEFEESNQTLVKRSEGLGFPLTRYMDAGLISIQHVRAGEITPNEFALNVRAAVEPDNQGREASIVLIDSLNGYLSSMPHERFLVVQLHEILNYLGKRGIATFLVVAQHGMMGHAMGTPVDTSYLADAVILFRYFEASGEIHRAISVVKNRTANHERTIREFGLSDKGLVIGEPLNNFRGVLAGTPEFIGPREVLLTPPKSSPE